MKRLIALSILILAIGRFSQAAIALVDHKMAKATSAGGTATTAAMNCSGANFIAAAVVSYINASTSATMSDSSLNTWSLKTTSFNQGNGTSSSIAIWYVENPTVSASQTVSAIGNTAGGGGYAIVGAACFSGLASSSSLDQQTGLGQTGGGTIQPGSITPGAAGELILSATGVTTTGSGSITISGGTPSMTLLDSALGDGSNGQGAGFAYAIQTTASATNPTWTFSVSGQGNPSADIASFKPAGAVVYNSAPAHVVVY